MSESINDAIDITSQFDFRSQQLSKNHDRRFIASMAVSSSHGEILVEEHHRQPVLSLGGLREKRWWPSIAMVTLISILCVRYEGHSYEIVEKRSSCDQTVIHRLDTGFVNPLRINGQMAMVDVLWVDCLLYLYLTIRVWVKCYETCMYLGMRKNLFEEYLHS